MADWKRLWRIEDSFYFFHSIKYWAGDAQNTREIKIRQIKGTPTLPIKESLIRKIEDLFNKISEGEVHN